MASPLWQKYLGQGPPGEAGDVLRLIGRAHQAGQAILLVTHDARVASMADRVINLFDGMVADDAKVVPLPRGMNGVRDVLELRG